ncbi:low affinity immunoglobulin epsilon Fc receptor-like [Mya arenaria]|uniref:low affinity immunoglobulin epsilon Fc receptor-like n=1 Tax=Mya arenaria TaxID=6604 RepID=UPI0022DFE855|nr:low affinity immunoglobulin epsilon Fc receptor-like [Mya arenaria]
MCVSECGPLIVSDEIVVRGNVNRIGSYIRLDCKEGYIPSFTKNTVECINTGNWTEHDMTCECEAGWTKFQTSCYQYFANQSFWDEAKRACEDDNAQLVSITSQEEYNFVHSYIQEANVGAIWIGASDRRVEGSWTWISGEKWDYKRFAEGEPNGGRKTNCLIMRNNSGWEDIGGKTNRFCYMCERKV